jgi:hypothetical protein
MNWVTILIWLDNLFDTCVHDAPKAVVTWEVTKDAIVANLTIGLTIVGVDIESSSQTSFSTTGLQKSIHLGVNRNAFVVTLTWRATFTIAGIAMTDTPSRAVISGSNDHIILHNDNTPVTFQAFRVPRDFLCHAQIEIILYHLSPLVYFTESTNNSCPCEPCSS